MEGSSSPGQLVYQALQCACSQNLELVKQAEQKLSEWEVEPGFYSTLSNIFSNQQVEINVRWMAAVCFKNGVNKYWRKNAKNEIQAAEKEQIKRQLIGNLSEPISQVAVQIAALIARIARFDCPKEWPELIPFLLEAVQKTDSLQQHRALLVLQHVVKALASKRMLNDKKIFEQLTSSVYMFILNLWDRFTTLFFQSLQENQGIEISIEYLEKATLSLRILRKLTVYGIHKPHHDENCIQFLKELFRRAKECIECRFELKRRNAADNLLELLEKFTLKQIKILNEFIEKHPISFVNLISTALEFSFNYVFHTGMSMIHDGNTITFSNFAIQCIILMHGILSSVAYNSYVQETASRSGVDVSVAITTKREFFTPERLKYICEKIITYYFVLTQSDIDSWMDDPEGFASDEAGDSWKYSLIPCTEVLYHMMFHQFRSEMTEEVVKYIKKAQEITLTPQSDLKDILLKDAIYNAAGLASFNLYDDIDFDAWLTNQLINEVQIPTDNFRIIRRRVITLIGQWTGVKISQSLKPEIYKLCLRLLDTNEDMCVRLAASKTLTATITDFYFEPVPFLEYLEPCFSVLFTLLKEAKECDTKMCVLQAMSHLVEKMGDNMVNEANKLITYLPFLWKESEDHDMLRCGIISTLLQIVKTICNIPPMLSEFLYPVIELSTDIKQPSHVYLLEEGLELWLAVIHNSTALNPELLNLSQNLLPIIEMSSENLRTVLTLLQAYIILSPDVYLQRHGKNIVSTCSYLLSDLQHEGVHEVMKLFETVLRADTNFGLELLKPVLPHIFEQIYENKVYTIVMTMYLSIIGRVLIVNQAVFIEALQTVNRPNPLETILDIWLTKMPLVTPLDKRKLLSLALGSLITADNPIFYERFSGILINICESLNDIVKEDADGSEYDCLVFAEDEDFDVNLTSKEDFEYKTYHYDRCKRICLKDPVHTCVLSDYIQSQITALRANLGDERYRALMQTVDVAILSNLADYISIFIDVPKVTETKNVDDAK